MTASARCCWANQLPAAGLSFRAARCSAALIRAPLTRHDDATFIDVVREGLVRFEGLLSSLGGGDGDIVIKD